MARGRDRHRARLDALAALGRPLARRARSACELCETAGESLEPWELPPAPDEPVLERTLLLCRRCHGGASNPDAIEADDWRFLENAVWGELPVARVLALRLLRALGQSDVIWARESAESAYLDEEHLALME